MNKLIIRSYVGDEEIRYTLLLKKEFYDEYLKVKSENPGIDDRVALKETSRRQSQNN